MERRLWSPHSADGATADGSNCFHRGSGGLEAGAESAIGDLGLSQPLAHQLLLAAFLLSPPGLLKVANAERQLPAWLAAAYKQMYETTQPVMTLGVIPPSGPSVISQSSSAAQSGFRSVP